MPALFRHGETGAGEPIDDAVVKHYTLMFATLGTMQFTGTVGRPTPGDPHAVYLEFDLALRQVMPQSMSLLTGCSPAPAAVLPSGPAEPSSQLFAKLADTLASIEPATALNALRKNAAAKQIEWLTRSDELGAEMTRRDLADVSVLLKCDFSDWAAAERALESHASPPAPSTTRGCSSYSARSKRAPVAWASSSRA
jgi:hypothetical protein